MRDAGVEVEKLWEEYSTRRDPQARERLILYYAPLVRRVAGRLGLPASTTLESEDVIGHGLAGLIEAVDRFDPTRGVPFESFAIQRIRGSILDALRALDYLPRTLRRSASQIEHAVAYLQGQLGRSPTDEEVAAYLGMDVDSYQELLSQVNIIFLSLDSPLNTVDRASEQLDLSEILEDPNVYDVSTQIEERDLHLELTEALQELPYREQLILSLYYYEELTVREVAEVLNLSPSRVSQLMARAIMSLRAKLLYNQPGPSRRANLCPAEQITAEAVGTAPYPTRYNHTGAAYPYREHKHARNTV
jgi:RNA polymerase sigma factor for flagellar operon FliA